MPTVCYQWISVVIVSELARGAKSAVEAVLPEDLAWQAQNIAIW